MCGPDNEDDELCRQWRTRNVSRRPTDQHNPTNPPCSATHGTRTLTCRPPAYHHYALSLAVNAPLATDTYATKSSAAAAVSYT